MTVMQISRAVMVTPPPLFYIAAFALGVFVEPATSLTHLDYARGGARAQVLALAAGALLLVGLVLGPLNAIRFLIRRTTLNPNKQASAFLTRGMYRFSRNPMYLGLFLIYVGIAILSGHRWTLATMVIPFLILDRIVVPFEEGQMAERYGSAYWEYCSRVRRWLTLLPAQRSPPRPQT
jgi:protein-S-isoprenylcysteine O-methyltransferase Ste14